MRALPPGSPRTWRALKAILMGKDPKNKETTCRGGRFVTYKGTEQIIKHMEGMSTRPLAEKEVVNLRKEGA